MEYFNSGIPCAHQFFIALKRHKKLLFHERWFSQFEKLASLTPNVLVSLQNQNDAEQTYVYYKLVGSSDQNLSIDAEDIKITQPKKQFSSNYKFGKTWLLPEGLSRFWCFSDRSFEDLEEQKYEKSSEGKRDLKSRTSTKHWMLSTPDKHKRRGRPPCSATKRDGNAKTEPMASSEATSVAKGDISEKVMVSNCSLTFLATKTQVG